MGALLNARDKLQILMPHLTCVDYLMAAATANGEQGQTDDYQGTEIISCSMTLMTVSFGMSAI